MAATNFTPISLYYSTTASAVPTAANLVPGELAINTNDGKLYYEDSSGVVQVLATKSTGSIGGSNTQVQFNNSGSLGGSSSFTWDGTTVTATKFAGALNGTVGATTASTGAFTTLTSNGATTFTAGTASTSTTTGTTVITGGLGVSGRINAANFDGIVGANTAAAGSFTNLAYTGTLTGGTGIVNLGSGQFYKDASGNVGIGETSPTVALVVKGTQATDGNITYSQQIKSTQAYNASPFAGLTFSNIYTSGGASANLSGIGGGKENATDGNYSSYLAFYTRVSGFDILERMRITSAGNVGIGTSSPSRLLTVQATGTGNVANFQSNAGPNIAFTGTETSGRTYLIGEGLVTAGNFSIYDSTGSAERLVVDSSGNLGLGVTPNSVLAGYKFFQLGITGATFFGGGSSTGLAGGAYYSGGWLYNGANYATRYDQSISSGQHEWYTAPSGTGAITFTQAMTLDNSGNLLVGATAVISSEKLSVVATGNAPSAIFKNASGSADYTSVNWNTATTGNNKFVGFYTETSATIRGDITYNRVAGLVAYNTTSDYRAKDIISPVLDSGKVIDSVPVYMGKMKGATQARPMFIAHETPDYAHTGEKDAVDKDGNPVYQQMDASSLIPVMWAEIQSLRQRIATLENK